MNAIQFLTDERGNRTGAVIPIELFNKLMAERHLDDVFESVPYEVGPDDDETTLEKSGIAFTLLS